MTDPRPATLRRLRLLPSGSVAPGTSSAPGTDTAPDTEGATGVTPDTVPVSPPVSPDVVLMTAPERAAVSLRHWGGNALAAAAGLWLHPGMLIHELVNAAPDPTRKHWDYVKSRQWVPRELRGTKAGKVITFSGWAYHLFAVAADKALQGLERTARKTRWVVQRPLRFFGILIPLIVILLIVI